MLFFYFNATATTEIYTDVHTLSLHDALPIWRRGIPVGTEAADRNHARGDDDDATPRRGRTASRRRLDGARALEQIRQRAVRRAFHCDVVSRPVSRSRRRRGDAPLRLADRRSRRGPQAGDALPRGAALGHLAHKAAHQPGRSEEAKY